jgi:ABC-type molybdate transport system substrate-binding protein
MLKNAMRSIAVSSLLGILSPLTYADAQALHIGVGGGFQPTMQSLASRLSHVLGTSIMMSSVPIEATYKTLTSAKSPYDLVILGDTKKMQTMADQGYIYADSIIEVAQSQIVLWCPDPRIMMRVSLNDTLNQPSVRRVGLSPNHSPVGQVVAQSFNLPQLGDKIIRGSHSLDTWRLARSGKADCAFTMLGLMRPSDRYSIIPNRSITLVTGIPRSNQRPDKARQVLQLLNSPLIKARIKSRGYS